MMKFQARNLAATLMAAIVLVSAAQAADLSPPAVPLVACDPYFSIWSPGDKLAEADTIHWTGKPNRLTSLAKIDGKVYRIMGARPADAPALEQKSLTVDPTQTEYVLAGGGVDVTVTFTTPSIPYDIDLLSRPITYVTYDVKSTDAKEHDVQLYFDASGELAVNMPEQNVTAADESNKELVTLKVGSKSQDVLGHSGDDIRIEWGYLYVAATADQVASHGVNATRSVRGPFVRGNDAAQANVSKETSPGGELVAGVTLKPLKVSDKSQRQWLVLAYDDLYSIEFMEHHLRPYWRRDGMDAAGLLKESIADYEKNLAACDKFDAELNADMKKLGGDDYAQLCALSYRQCFAAGKFVADANGQPISFCKENHSNGCIATSDVFYPMAPQFLMFGPSLAKSFMAPFMEYATSPRWKFPFAPHDIGTYPKANGQVYGGGEQTEENQMPVEETGNVMLLMAAISQMEGNTQFADRYWPQLTKWAEYLQEKGFDPENQLCTDDFAGHLAHNVNLSVKAICGLGAYAKMAEMRGDAAEAAKYRKIAKQFAEQWVDAARDGDHYRLTFDGPGTWSQKYNMVWDKILDLKLFPDAVRRTEMDYYLKKQNDFGLPLDNRSKYTKLDWILWTATLTGEQSDFEALVKPVMKYVNETDNRQPLSDWYYSHDAKKVGFTARPVIGGVFLRTLYDAPTWTKWASRDVTKAGDYAKLPVPPKVTVLVATAEDTPATWKYTTERPGPGWFEVKFDTSKWKEGKGGFGTRETPSAAVNTVWNGRNIWIRREFDLPKHMGQPRLRIHHDEDVKVYINGVLAVERAGWTTSYTNVAISKEAIATLKPTGNVIAIQVRQEGGGQYIDAGVVEVEDVK